LQHEENIGEIADATSQLFGENGQFGDFGESGDSGDECQRNLNWRLLILKTLIL
jgi:hypothetical protein